MDDRRITWRELGEMLVVVDPRGVAVTDVAISVHEIVMLAGPHPQKGKTVITDEHGRFSISWEESAPRVQTRIGVDDPPR